MTSDQAPVWWPFIATPGLPPTGAQMGIDLLSGGPFYADPAGWVLDDTIPVTNPNMFVFGKPGRGKSATVKACEAIAISPMTPRRRLTRVCGPFAGRSARPRHRLRTRPAR